MIALSGKTLLIWLSATIAWLAVTAALGWMGVPSVILLMLHILATGTILWRIARGTVVQEGGEFLVPRRDGPSVLTPYGVAAAWISGFGTVGVTAAILIHGPVAWALPAGIVGGLVLAQTVLARSLADSGVRSLPHWVEWRYGDRAGQGAAFILALAGIAILTLQMGFAALLASVLCDVPALLLLPLVAALVLLAVLTGGLGTMAPAQAALFLVLVAGVLVPALWLGMSRTGIVLPHVAPGALLHEIAVAEGKLGIQREVRPFAAAILGLTALFGTLALPHTLVRWPAERSAVDAGYFAQRGTTLALLVLTAVPIFAITAYSEQLFAALAGGQPLPVVETAAEALAAGMALVDPPAWLRAALGIGALAAIVSASASAAFLVATTAIGDPERETAGGGLSKFRWASAGAVILATVLALVLPFDPLGLFMALLALAASSLLAPLMLGVLWADMNTRGALAGLIVGAASYVGFGLLGWSIAGGLALIGLAASVLASIVVSLIWSEPTLSPPIPFPPST